MKPGQRRLVSSLAKRLSSPIILALLIFSSNAFADPLLLVRIVDSIDLAGLSEIKNLRLNAVVKLDEKGDMVVSCLNHSLPVAHRPFDHNPGMLKIVKNARLEVDPKEKGVMVKLAFLF